MVDNIHRDPALAVPCALKHCLSHGYDAQNLAALSQHERRIGFQHWVEYTRTASSALTSEIIAKENLICPLLWCRTSFEDIPSILRHISSCSWLSDGWYWCPSCCRPEWFTECEFTYGSHAHQDEPEEKELLRRAVAFFKDFSRNDIRAHSPDLSRVTIPDLRPSIIAYPRRSSDEHHPLVGRTQEKGYNASEPPRIERIFKSHAYIAVLRDVVRALGEEWFRRLVLGTIVPQILPEQYATSLFELGIRALRNYVRGATPSSFQDIFALVHVAMAFSYIVRKDDHAHSWDTFLEEAYQWQHLLCNVIEKRAFTKVMSRLCHPQAYSTSSPLKEATVDNDFLPAEQATLVGLIGRLSYNRVDLANQENGDDHRQPSNAANEQFKLLEMLPSNVIIKECMECLDSFGHAVIVEDLASRQINSSWYIAKHMPGIETLDSNIVGPLHDWKGLEGFRGGITEVQKMLRCGVLHSARDIEVMLVWFGKSCSRSPQLLKTYLDVVKDLCDTVMKECGLLWRNQSYEVILGTVLATAAELSRFRGHALPIPPATPLENLNLSYNASTPPASAAISPAVLHASTPCSPNLVQASLAASDDASHCPDPSCKALFTGSSQTTNLRRHLRTALHHNQDAKFECGICRVTFGRPDNLQQHIRNVHGLDPALKHHQRTRISSQSRGARG